jgi:hypothetical protein
MKTSELDPTKVWAAGTSRPLSRFSSIAWLTRMTLVVALAVALGGCFLMPGTPNRPNPEAPVAGPVPYVENCQNCHGAPVGKSYAQSLHAAKGIRCEQCHTPGGHPNFAQPIRDGKCGGCHDPQYQQTLETKHFATRELRALDDDRAGRATLRREGFTAVAPGGRRFVGDASSGDLGGRLCVACHYDEHRLGLASVQRADFCTLCHAGPEDHYAMPTNRCIQCHVRVGETMSGQVVNTHRIDRSGTERAGR